MKNLIYIVLMTLIPLFAFSQVYVKAPNGDVGVGMDTPTEKLDVNGKVKSTGNTVLVTGASGTTLFERTDGAAILVGAGTAGGGFTFDEAYNFEVRSKNRTSVQNRYLSSGYVFIRGKGSNGNLGVNINNPSTKLHVNGSITYSGSLINASDRRLKKNTSTLEDGLGVILQLNPIRYQYNGKADIQNTNTHIGLFAQELQEAAPYLVKEFTYEEENDEGMVSKSENYLAIEENAIKYLLINAVKEQQEIIDTQDEKIEDLEKRLARIEALLGAEDMEINRQDIQLNGSDAYLEQNQPNPFNANTLIKYSVPADAADAVLNVFNVAGQIVHSKLITNMGKGEIQIKAGTIAAGTYSYLLVGNGNIVDTKRMIIAK